MNKPDVPARLVNLPCSIRGYVVHTPDSETIVLNSRLSHETNVQTYFHELRHIMNDDFYREESADEIERLAHKAGGGL